MVRGVEWPTLAQADRNGKCRQQGSAIPPGVGEWLRGEARRGTPLECATQPGPEAVRAPQATRGSRPWHQQDLGLRMLAGSVRCASAVASASMVAAWLGLEVRG